MKLRNMSLLLLSFLLYLLKSVNCQIELIDPFAMNENTVESKIAECNCPKYNNVAVSLYKRTINMLLNAVQPEHDQETHSGQLFLNVQAEDYEFLKNFANNKVDDAQVMRKVDNILAKIYAKPKLQHLSESFSFWSDLLYFNFYNRSSLIFLSIVFLLFISYKLLRAKLTVWTVAKYLIFVAWVVDFAFTWIHLLQNVEINRMSDMKRYQEVPPHCDPQKMSMLQYFWYSLSTVDECKAYHNAMLSDVFWSVGPFTVLSYQLGIVIKTPAVNIGNAIGGISAGIMDKLPWGLNIIMLPILLIFTIICLCICLSFITNKSFGFNFLHILQLNFGDKNRRRKGDFVTGDNLKKLLDITHRKVIEEIPASKAKVLQKNPKTSAKTANHEEPGYITKEEEFKACELRGRKPKRILKDNQEENTVKISGETQEVLAIAHEKSLDESNN